MLDAMRNLVIEGKNVDIVSSVNEAIKAGIPVREILQDGLIAAMDEVGQLFERGDYYVPEMLVAARAMKAGLAVIQPHLVENEIDDSGVIVLGTVEGDLHDIGKNLVSVMLEGAGYKVIDLGADVTPEIFASVAREKQAKVVGLSALLTTTMKKMGEVLEAIEDLGIRHQVRVIVGGAPVTQEFADEVGADGYAPDASTAVALVKRMLQV
jgi:5-methyltetrahydrofolate--homocysteine methyltransferase